MSQTSIDLREYASWLRRRGRADSTIEQYRRLLGRLLTLDDPASPLLNRCNSPMYRHSMAAALRSWADFANDGQLAARISDIRLPSRLRRGSRDPLDRAEWFRIIEAIENSQTLAPATTAALAMIATRGLRCGDVLRLERKALAEAKRTGVLQLVAKGERLIRVNAEPLTAAIGMLVSRSWKEVVTVADLVSPKSRRECSHASAARAIRRALDEVAKDHGMDRRDLYPHRFRHTYVHHFLGELRGDPEALVKVQQQMGWARMETAGSYMRRARQAELDAVESKLLSGRKKSH